MNQGFSSKTVIVQLKLLSKPTFAAYSHDNPGDICFGSFCGHYEIDNIRMRDNNVLIGQNVTLFGTITNNTNNSFHIKSIQHTIQCPTGKSRIFDDSMSYDKPSAGMNYNNPSTHKNYLLNGGECVSHLVSWQVNDVGTYMCRLTVVYFNGLVDVASHADVVLDARKPIDVGFIKKQLKDNQYMITTTVRNVTEKPFFINSMQVTRSAHSLPSTVLFHSFSKPVFLTPGGRYNCLTQLTHTPTTISTQPSTSLSSSHSLSHSLNDVNHNSFGQMHIGLSVSGCTPIPLNSSKIQNFDIDHSVLRMHYESLPTLMHSLTEYSINFIVFNSSNHMIGCRFDWSNMSGRVRVIGECVQSKLLPPNKAIRLPLKIIALAKGDQRLEPPITHLKESLNAGIRAEGLSIHVI